MRRVWDIVAEKVSIKYICNRNIRAKQKSLLVSSIVKEFSHKVKDEKLKKSMYLESVLGGRWITPVDVVCLRDAGHLRARGIVEITVHRVLIDSRLLGLN